MTHQDRSKQERCLKLNFLQTTWVQREINLKLESCSPYSVQNNTLNIVL